MTPQTKKIIIWSSVAVILGAAGYFLYTKFGKPEDGTDGKTDNDTPTPTPTPTQTPTPTPTQTPTPTPTPNASGLTDAQNKILTRVENTSVKMVGGKPAVLYLYLRSGRGLWNLMFYSDDTFAVLNEGGYAMIRGTYSDGGRKIRITKDNFSITSKVGTTITTNNFFKTFEKLFSNPKNTNLFS
jgi:hypothetical protein